MNVKLWNRILLSYQAITIVLTALCYFNVIPLPFVFFLIPATFPMIAVLMIWFSLFIYFIYKSLKPRIVYLLIKYELYKIRKEIDRIEKEI